MLSSLKFDFHFQLIFVKASFFEWVALKRFRCLWNTSQIFYQVIGYFVWSLSLNEPQTNSEKIWPGRQFSFYWWQQPKDEISVNTRIHTHAHAHVGMKMWTASTKSCLYLMPHLFIFLHLSNSDAHFFTKPDGLMQKSMLKIISHSHAHTRAHTHTHRRHTRTLQSLNSRDGAKKDESSEVITHLKILFLPLIHTSLSLCACVCVRVFTDISSFGCCHQ